MSISLSFGIFSIGFGVTTMDEIKSSKTVVTPLAETKPTIHSLVRSAELEMEKTKTEASKKCHQISEDAAKEWQQEQARILKIRTDAQQAARKEEAAVKKQAKERYIQQVLSLVTNAIVDLKEEQFQKEQGELLASSAAVASTESSSSSSSVGASSASTTTTSSGSRSTYSNNHSSNSLNKEDPQVKALIRVATDKLCYYDDSYDLSVTQVSQRLLEYVATEIVARQLRAQQAAFERSKALEQELASLRVQYLDESNRPPPPYNPEYHNDLEHDTPKVYLAPFLQRQAIIKERFAKAYRHPTLDKKLTSRRVVQEARCLNRCQKALIDTPTVYMVDIENSLIYMEFIEGISVREFLVTDEGQTAESQKRVAQEIGTALGKMHNIDVVHGDLTTSNLMMRGVRDSYESVVLIDFGLSYVSNLIEDKAVDLYVLERAFTSTHPNTEVMFAQILEAYGESGKASKLILKKLEDVRMRGRKRSMLG
ncbi:TP53 regulating kinase [Gryganskiella cystojenkinii]|nr:TP53 regulating kinase [Gryganskiella cystojenkinii]